LFPQNAAYYSNIGLAYQGLNKLVEAEASYRKALKLRPNYAEAYFNLANTLKLQGKLDDAIAGYQNALSLQSNYAQAYNNQATVLQLQNKPNEAIALLQKALVIAPEYAEAHNNLGNVLKEQGRHAEATVSFQKALSISPNSAEIHYNLGIVLSALGKFDEAIQSYQKAIALRPDYVEAHNNLGIAYKESGQLDLASACYQKAIALNPGYVEAHNNLGRIFQTQGKLNEAIACLRRALMIKPDFVDAHSILLFIGLNSPSFLLSELFAEHVRFAERFETPLKQYQRHHLNMRDPNKRLKIGYVSADLRRHAVAYFMESVLAHHDKSQFEIFCYYNHSQIDQVTERLRAYANHWIVCDGMADEYLTERIRADGIDILVDLSGHSTGNRLLVFARKPAPVQVTYLGYPGTTGLSAMDYRITDNYLDPVGMTEQFNTEKLWRLPDIISCYRPDDNSPAVIEHPPMEDNGYVTFGCFNNFTKVTDEVLAVWGRILDKVPNSCLMLEINGIDSEPFYSEVQNRMKRIGIPSEKLILIPRKRENQFVLYNRIDIALDPFPYNGGTTSFDTLWMGVPFVALAGAHAVSRMGVSTLTNAGLGELVGQTADEYVEIAAALALDASRLKQMRTGLRDRVKVSSLMDGKRFTHHMEDGFRAMWKNWCESGR
jgi:protein O-GlcNAc transferase